MPAGKLVKWFVATADEWAESNEILEVNYVGLEADTGLIKLGNGMSAWNDLRYVGGDKAKAVKRKDDEPLEAAEWEKAKDDTKAQK